MASVFICIYNVHGTYIVYHVHSIYILDMYVCVIYIVYIVMYVYGSLEENVPSGG